MGTGDTLHRFRLDAGGETLELALARHPSETADAVRLRALAYALLHRPGLRARAALCRGDEPALWAGEGPGPLDLWVEVGRPAARRLERARAKAAEVWVVLAAGPRADELADGRPARVGVLAIDPVLLAALPLERRARWRVERSGGRVRVEGDGWRAEGALVERPAVPSH